jgi:hypothetical protein
MEFVGTMANDSSPAGVGYCEFCQHKTYLPCQDAEKAERCQLAGQAAMDYDCAEAACCTLFEQWWECGASERRAWRAKMMAALATAKAVEARGIQRKGI